MLRKMFSNVVFNVDSNESKNDVLLLRNRTSTKSFAIKKDRKFNNDKYKKLFVLFNVHVNLHLVDITRKYVIVMNVNFLLYEIKHM